MKKLFSILFLSVMVLGAGAIVAQMSGSNNAMNKAIATTAKADAIAQEKDFPSDAIVGYVASLNGIIRGGDGKVNQAEAQKLVDTKQPLVFRDKRGRIYFCYSGGGSYYGKILAKKAGETIGIKGNVKSIAGVRVLIITNII